MNRPGFVIAVATGIALWIGAPSGQAAPPPATGASVAGQLGAALPDTALATHRGGHAAQLNIANLHAKLTQNKALDNVTGDNYVGQSAFSNANGFATVVQNSGNNVIIQNSTIVNLKMQ
ncbi:MAG: hypothetical protein P8124_00065 [Gammaproteobacteria bacterium]